MSDMEKKWLFACVLVAVMQPFASINVTHVYEPLNWWQASDRCDNDGLEFKESIFKKHSILKGKTFWIGKASYSKTSDWFEIIGCYTVTITAGMTELSTVTSLGECEIKCKSYLPKLPKNVNIYFGYKETTKNCICARNIPVVNTDIRECVHQKSSSAYIFYQVYQSSVYAGQGQHCTTLQCLNGHTNLKAVNCLVNNVNGRCANDKNSLQWGETFMVYLDACKLRNQLLLPPSTYCKTEEHKNQGIVSWTNVFRKVFKSELTKEEGGNETPLKCLAGQLMYFNGTWNLIRTEMDCSIGLDWFLCKKAEAQSSTAPSAVYFTSKSLMIFPKSSDTTSSLERMSDIPHSSRPEGLTKDTKLQKDHNYQGGNSKTIDYAQSLGAIIGGVIGSCSVIALIAAVIVCKVRSIGVFKESSKHEEQETIEMDFEFSKATHQNSNNTIDKRSTTPTTSNKTYGLPENRTPVYAVVNKIKTEENINDTYTDAEDGEYDHLHDIQNRKINPKENLYHSHGVTRNQEDLTYDSSDFGKGKGKTYDENGVYDHSFSVVEGEYSYSTNKNLVNTNRNDMGIYDKAS